MLKADQLLNILVPQGQGDAFQTLPKGDFSDFWQVRGGVVTFLQAVIGDHATEMVEMVKADIAGKPLEDFRQIIIGAAEHGGTVEIPILTVIPSGIIELMLDKEHPAANPGRDADHRQIGQQKGFKADQGDESPVDDQEHEIKPHDALPDFFEGQRLANWKSLEK